MRGFKVECGTECLRPRGTSYEIVNGRYRVEIGITNTTFTKRSNDTKEARKNSGEVWKLLIDERLRASCVERLWTLQHAAAAQRGELADEVGAAPAALGLLLERHARVFRRHCGAIGTIRRQRIIDVHDTHDLREERDVLAGQPGRIAAAVRPLVMTAHDRPDHSQQPQIAAQAIADRRMAFDDFKFFGSERTGLLEE